MLMSGEQEYYLVFKVLCVTASQEISTGVSSARIPRESESKSPSGKSQAHGRYAGHGGRSHRGCDHEVGTEVTIFTRTGIRRIARYAFQLASARPRKMLTYVTKSNAMRNGMVMWDEVINEVAQEFPDVVSCAPFVPSAPVKFLLIFRLSTIC
jgi:hypothetical protein